jgi:hypothetical protein
MNPNNDTSSSLEHLNLTVSNPDHAAKLLCELFGWQIRWSGAAMDNGRTVHVGKPGNGGSYLALYTHTDVVNSPARGANQVANLNHIGILSANLDDVEKRLKERGISSFNYGNYDPGKRFYFYMDDQIEVEVISYD